MTLVITLHYCRYYQCDQSDWYNKTILKERGCIYLKTIDAHNGLRPMSAFKYFVNNKKRSASMMLAIAVSVLLVMVFQIVFYAVLESGRLAFSGRLDLMTVVYPGENGSVGENVQKDIKQNPYIEKTVPMQVLTTDYYHFFGNINIPVYLVGNDNVQYVMNALNLTLSEGRLPEAGKNEMLLDKRTANNKGKQLGDYIGREVDHDERMPGKYRVVGILEGGTLLGISTVEADSLSERNGMLFFAADLDKANAILKDVSTEDAITQTKELGESYFESESNMINSISSVIIGIIILIMSFAAGNLSYAQAFSRRYEFGTLQAVGYSKMHILLKAGREILMINTAGFLVGILLALLAAAGLNALIFQPRGYPFVLMQYEGIWKAMVIPLCTAVFSLIPAWWLMSKVDPMTVVEKFE